MTIKSNLAIGNTTKGAASRHKAGDTSTLRGDTGDADGNVDAHALDPRKLNSHSVPLEEG